MQLHHLPWFRVVIVSFQKRLVLPAAVLLCIAPLGAPAQQQVFIPGNAYNTWTSGLPMPTATASTAVGVINGQIYVVGGGRPSLPPLAITQIYDPATNTWSAGAPLPVGTDNGAIGAVVNNILYVFGGGTESEGVTSAVWAYNPETNSWSSKSPMPTARGCAGAAVENDIIYVIGGCGEDPGDRLTTVESYDPATDMWTEEAPLLVGKSQPSVALVGTTIVAADGYTASGPTGDSEGYDVTTNSWTSLKPDPMARNGACAGAIDGELLVAGGVGVSTESFNLSHNAWETLAPMRQPTQFPASAVYNGHLYCFGGLLETVLNHVQIYQVSATALKFGIIAFGTTETLPLTITNAGVGPLTIAPSINGPSYIISGSTCTGGVTAGNSCTLQVQFLPVAVGHHDDILILQTNGPTNPTVSLHGQASGVGVEMEDPLQFGTIAFGSTKVLPLTITNFGWPGTVTLGTSIGGPSYKVLTTAQNTCVAGITAGQSCTLPIEFDPVSVGMHDDILTLTPSGGAAASTPHLDGFAN